MDKIEYQEFIDSIKPNPTHIEIIDNLCEQMGINQIHERVYSRTLWKLGKKDMIIMLITLTTGIGHEWQMGASISEVYEKIKTHFK